MSSQSLSPRRGIILLVVLVLLTMFAVVGLGFVLYADSQARSANISKEAEKNRGALDPRVYLSSFLAQFIFDADDDTGTRSALRGHSLARSMFGFNYDTTTKLPLNNTTPFNGVGRLHNALTSDATHVVPAAFSGQDEYPFINYSISADGFVRDPERPGIRATSGAKAAFVGGFNAPYTYPDLNSLFLAAIDANGNVISPSYHRASIFNPSNVLSDQSNANWTNTLGKYLTLRPRPQEHTTLFPYPSGTGGDVANLPTSANNDSIWIDLGSQPVSTGDGRYYKPLFAPLVIDLDSRVNLNVHGNVMGQNRTHVSNTGWGPWSVNLAQVLMDPAQQPTATGNTEWNLLFVGQSGNYYGRYGADQSPGTANSTAAIYPPISTSALTPTKSRFYSQISFDEGNYSGGSFRSMNTDGSKRFSPTPATGTFFPTYYIEDGYRDLNATQSPLLNHPLLYTKSGSDDVSFADGNMATLWNAYDTTTSQPPTYQALGNLCPDIFGTSGTAPLSATARARIASLITLKSNDVDVPGLSPWLSARTGYTLAASTTVPAAQFAAFPSVATITAGANGDFSADGRMNFTPAGTAGLLYAVSKRLDLNRPLPDYPAADSTTGLISDTTGFNAAQTARQDLAKDIFDRLRLVTGADDPTTATGVSKDALRWLAQLAVNIVDFIDNDDYMTPFNWIGTEYVFGTELPRVFVNEVLVQLKKPTQGPNSGKNTIDVWIELMNPFNQDTALSESGSARMQVTASTPYNAYQLYLCKYNSLATLVKSDNVLGTPSTNYAVGSPTLDLVLDTTTGSGSTGVGTLCQVNDFTAKSVLQPWNGSGTQCYMLLGPNAPFTTQTGSMGTGGQPSGMPTLNINDSSNTNHFSYIDSAATPQPPTIVLQRLACPGLPAQSNSALANYNPYVTVDIFQNACDFSAAGTISNDVTTASTPVWSDGRANPFMGKVNGTLRNKQKPTGTGVNQTFLAANDNQTGFANQWLVHLDRCLSSPMELLHVSGFKPHELTQQFGDSGATPLGTYNQRVPWFDEDLSATPTKSHRLYRFFEMVETRSWMNGLSPVTFQGTSNVTAGAAVVVTPSTMTALTPTGVPITFNVGDVLVIEPGNATNMENVRVTAVAGTTFTATFLRNHTAGFTILHTATSSVIPGKINLNTLYASSTTATDGEVFRALCDAQANVNTFTGPTTLTSYNWTSATDDVSKAFQNMQLSLHPGGAGTLGATDKPFKGMAMGQTNTGDTQYPTGSGIGDTFFRPSTSGSTVPLFVPNSKSGATIHPYLRHEMLNKIYNNVTSRSNVFAVWLTVGFFEVDASTGALKGELTASQGFPRRRMFAIVDRSQLATARLATTLPTAVTANATQAAFGSTAGITAGTQLIINPGQASAETVTVTGITSGATPIIQAVFTKAHAAGEPVYIAPGFFGPQPSFDVTQAVHQTLIPYYGIIQ